METIGATIRTPATLEYAAPPPLHRRRIFRYALWLTVAVGVIAAVAWRWGPPYARQLRYLYWQSRCMAFEAPADHVAYEEDPTRAAALLAGPGYQPANPIDRQVPAGTQPPVGFVPPPMLKLLKGWVCMAFVGERTSAGGQKRLVVLGYQVQLQSNGDRTFDLYGSGKTLATPRPGTQLEGSGVGVNFHLRAGDVLRVFWGQRHPREGDRFTIGYSLNGQSGVIDGKLLEDGKLETIVRDGPLRARTLR